LTNQLGQPREVSKKKKAKTQYK